MRERDIFIAALPMSAPERTAYLASACGEDRELRRLVDELLTEHEREQTFFLDAPVPGVNVAIDQPPPEKPGTLIGPYKLLQQIGEGGMGVVYMAEQAKPVERRVALKIIKPGMDTRQVIARFEAERQALAMMDHPNIAKVFEAGTTESGRPYFVMELVKGIPITRYCDEKHLSLQERLKLMIPVCQAIQHAHQKGIIHRDIKPTNVLVAQYDGRPVPKVIDFGVAKATAQKLTERTMFTELGQVVGTVEYMSPEQAELNQLDIDTRSDIYSLGVLLYELLAGTTPFDRQKLRSTAFHEMLRIIREDEPPKPSISLSTSGTLASISANRQTDPAHLSKAVRGELDWIVMKALEKDRNRRYETANGLASDLQRYLNDEQVQACPPSARYRFGKFVRKNRATLSTAAIVALALLVGTGVSTWQAVRATSAESVARANETQSRNAAAAELAAKQAEVVQRRRAETSEHEANARLADVERQRRQAELNFEAALDAVGQMLARVYEEELNDVPRVGPLRRKVLKDVIAFYERVPSQSGMSKNMRLRVAETWGSICAESWGLNEHEQGRRAYRVSITALEDLLAEQPEDPAIQESMAHSYRNAAWILEEDSEGPVQHLRKAIALFAKLSENKSQGKSWQVEEALTLSDLAKALQTRGRRDEALVCSARALKLVDLAATATANDRSQIFYQAGMLAADEASREDLLRRAVVECRTYLSKGEKYTQERWWCAGRLDVIAGQLHHRHPDEAERLWDESILVWREECGGLRRDGYFHFVRSLLNQARFLRGRAASGAQQHPLDARVTKSADRFQEALETERKTVSRFALREDRFELVEMLQEDYKYRINQETEEGKGKPEDAATSQRQSAALLAEAIQCCRQLSVEFPNDATYSNRLAELLKLQAQRMRATGEPNP